jgi:hypothetical protein
MAFAGDHKSISDIIKNLPREKDEEGRDFAVIGDMMIPLPGDEPPGGMHTYVFKPGVKLWPNGTVPYAFHANVSPPQQAMARHAMNQWESGSPFRFVPRNGQATYLLIRDSDRNRSTVGRVQGVNNLQLRDWDLRTICHELAHVFGLWHEHQRPDRDHFVEILWDNINPQYQHDWEIIANGIVKGPYDFTSVTHYEPDRGALPQRIAIRCRPPWQNQQGVIGQAQVPSYEDKRELEQYYRDKGAFLIS